MLRGDFFEKMQHPMEDMIRRLYGCKSEKLDPNQLLLEELILSAKALYPDCGIPPGDISNCHNGQVQPDGSVTQSLLGGTEYLIHLANGKCCGIG